MLSARMPSPRPATSATSAMRPTSPLSPRFEGSRYDTLQQQSRQPSSQPKSPSRGPTQRRQYGNSLTLPGLPRFHPANYPSAHSSLAGTPATGPNSPVLHQRFPGPGRQLSVYQADYISLSRPTSASANEEPTSPRLQPLGSPGPVTPLELASADGYLAVVKPVAATAIDAPEELARKLADAANTRAPLSAVPVRPPRSRS